MHGGPQFSNGVPQQHIMMRPFQPVQNFQPAPHQQLPHMPPTQMQSQQQYHAQQQQQNGYQLPPQQQFYAQQQFPQYQQQQQQQHNASAFGSNSSSAPHVQVLSHASLSNSANNGGSNARAPGFSPALSSFAANVVAKPFVPSRSPQLSPTAAAGYCNNSMNVAGESDENSLHACVIAPRSVSAGLKPVASQARAFVPASTAAAAFVPASANVHACANAFMPAASAPAFVPASDAAVSATVTANAAAFVPRASSASASVTAPTSNASATESVASNSNTKPTEAASSSSSTGSAAGAPASTIAVSVAETPRTKATFLSWHRSFWQLAKTDPEAAYKSGLAQLRMAPQRSHWKITMELADLSRRHNRPALARCYYQATLHLNPAASHAYMEYAKVAEETGNLHQCLNILMLGLQRCANPDDAMIIKAIKQHERFGNLAAARAILASVLDASLSKSWYVANALLIFNRKTMFVIFFLIPLTSKLTHPYVDTCSPYFLLT